MTDITDIFSAAKTCLAETDIKRKIDYSLKYAEMGLMGQLKIPLNQESTEKINVGFPEKPVLVHPRKLSRRGFGSKDNRLALLHSLAHIEFNAINIAWDAVLRFRQLPVEYYKDWMNIAAEETRHFMLLQDLLHKQDMQYGDLPAHLGLWDMVEQTAHNVLHRMAIIPRVYEARGLDVTPEMIEKFAGTGELEASRVLEQIYTDEIGHVQIGDKWYKYLCDKNGFEPIALFQELFIHYVKRQPKVTLNQEARKAAGFSDLEMEFLVSQQS